MPLSTLVNLKLERLSGAVTEITSDLSLGGMFVPSDTPAEIGSLVAFEFKVGEDLVEGTGEVVWVRMEGDGPDHPPGMGIRFRYLSPGSRERIFRLVQRYAHQGDDALKIPGGAPGKAEDDTEPTVPLTRPPAMAPASKPTPPAVMQKPAGPQPAGPERDAPSVARPMAASPIAAASAPADHLSVRTEPLPALQWEDPTPEAFRVAEVEVDYGAMEAAAAAPPAVGGPPKIPTSQQTGELPEFPAPPPVEAVPEAEDLPEVPSWLRPDPPDLPDLPVARVSEPVSPADLANGYGTDLANEAGRHPGGQWKVRGAGYAGGKSGRGFRINWRTAVFAALIALLALFAFYRLGGPLLARFAGEEAAPAPARPVADESPVASATRSIEGAATAAEPAAAGTESAEAGTGDAEPETADSVSDVAGTATATAPTAEPEPGASGGPAPDATAASAISRPSAAGPEPSTETAAPTPSVATPRPTPRETPVAVAPSRPMSAVASIRVRSVSEGTLVAIETDGAITPDRYKRLRLESAPPRELIRLSGILRPFEGGRVAADTGELRGIRTGLHAGGELHVVLDLTSPNVQVASADVVGKELRILLRTP